MSRRKKNLRAFLYQNPDATIEQAWDSAWEGAQKHYHSKTMNELQQQLAEAQGLLKKRRIREMKIEAENAKLKEAAQAVVKAKANQDAGVHTAYHTGIAVEALAALLGGEVMLTPPENTYGENPLQVRIDQLEAENAKLREAIREYAANEHFPDCKVLNPRYGRQCNCGHDALAALLGGEHD